MLGIIITIILFKTVMNNRVILLEISKISRRSLSMGRYISSYSLSWCWSSSVCIFLSRGSCLSELGIGSIAGFPWSGFSALSVRRDRLLWSSLIVWLAWNNLLIVFNCPADWVLLMSLQISLGKDMGCLGRSQHGVSEKLLYYVSIMSL